MPLTKNYYGPDDTYTGELDIPHLKAPPIVRVTAKRENASVIVDDAYADQEWGDFDEHPVTRILWSLGSIGELATVMPNREDTLLAGVSEVAVRKYFPFTIRMGIGDRYWSYEDQFGLKVLIVLSSFFATAGGFLAAYGVFRAGLSFDDQNVVDLAYSVMLVFSAILLTLGCLVVWRSAIRQRRK